MIKDRRCPRQAQHTDPPTLPHTAVGQRRSPPPTSQHPHRTETTRCLRRASLRDNTKAKRENGEAPGMRVSHPVGTEGVAGQVHGVKVVQPPGAPPRPRAPGPLQDEPVDATGYPLRATCPINRTTTYLLSTCCSHHPRWSPMAHATAQASYGRRPPPAAVDRSRNS
jgi:hypothetical protein